MAVRREQLRGLGNLPDLGGDGAAGVAAEDEGDVVSRDGEGELGPRRVGDKAAGRDIEGPGQRAGQEIPDRYGEAGGGDEGGGGREEEEGLDRLGDARMRQHLLELQRLAGPDGDVAVEGDGEERAVGREAGGPAWNLSVTPDCRAFPRASRQGLPRLRLLAGPAGGRHAQVPAGERPELEVAVETSTDDALVHRVEREGSDPSVMWVNDPSQRLEHPVGQPPEAQLEEGPS
mmetsp:Transcript_9846/g.32934  ORF Transcript_9846/g.32934 Transcript_9846/m.32934 type:complete len:232 (-) Transcript_9846:1372-2067(-)